MTNATKALLAGAVVLIASSGCSSKAPEAAKPIPPTPTIDQFRGATSETPLKNSRSSTDPR